MKVTEMKWFKMIQNWPRPSSWDPERFRKDVLAHILKNYSKVQWLVGIFHFKIFCSNESVREAITAFNYVCDQRQVVNQAD